MAPVSSTPPAFLPPQIKTDLPMATVAGWMRPTKPVGGGAMLTQPARHAPLAHSRPASQTLPQLPQFCASVVISTHVPAQHFCSGVHGGEHTVSCDEPPAPACASPPPAVPPDAVLAPPSPPWAPALVPPPSVAVPAMPLVPSEVNA